MQRNILKKKIYIILAFCFLSSLTSGIFNGSLYYASVDPDIEVLVQFEQGYDYDHYPGVFYTHKWDRLNGFSGIIPYELYEEWKLAPYIKSIEVVNHNRIEGILAEDNLDTGIDDIQAERVWGGSEDAKNVNTAIAGEDVNVLICDSGIDYTHEDIALNYVWGYDWLSPDDDPMDTLGHGTHCAGVIGALDNGIGYIGVAPKVNLYAARVAAYDSLDIDALIDAIYWAAFPTERAAFLRPPNNPRMDIISMSIQLASGYYLLEEIINLAFNEGITLVASTGNYPQTSPKNFVAYPARYANVIAVGAAEKVGDEYQWASGFSCYGPQVDVVAPGVGIWSTWLGNSYDQKTGTSASCPMVAGTCALMMSAKPYLKSHPQEVRTILHDTAQDIDASGRDDHTGYGLIDAEQALIAVNNLDTQPPSVSITSPSSTLVHDTVTIRASASDDIGVTYVECKIGSGSWMKDYYSPYKWYWDTTPYTNGQQFIIQCKAWDDVGNYDIATKTVTVLNGGGGGGDGGCPVLFINNGTELLYEGLLNIHNPNKTDVIFEHELTNTLPSVNHRYNLKLIEHYKTFSFIDKVELWGVFSGGGRIKLPLLSAYHSKLDQVRMELWFSDDKKVTLLGENYNNGTSQSIDLEFFAPRWLNFDTFVFTIEGHNYVVK